MKLPDIESVNKAACGPCGYPDCPEAVVECQSITVQACGVQIPVDETATTEDSRYVPAEDRCKIYKRVVDRYVQSTTFSGPAVTGESKTGSYEHNSSCAFNYVWSTVPSEEVGDFPERICGPSQSSNATVTENSAVYNNAVKQYDYTVSGNSSSGPGVPCSGSITETVTYVGEDPEELVSPMGCDCPPVLNLTGSEVVYAGGTFTETSVDVSTDQTTTYTHTQEYSEPVTVADLKAEATARAALYGTEHDWPGSECQTKVEFSHGYPIPPEGEEPDPEAESVCSQVQELTLARFRRGVPVGFSTVEKPRTKFRERGEDWFFPTKWDLWDQALGLYEQWEKDHAAWVAGGGVGIEPVEPPEPGDEPEEKPRLVLEWEWTWSGTMANRFSEWFIRELPEDVIEPGMVRSVNVATWCYNSTKTGTKPTFHGEIYVPATEEEEP